MTNLLHRRHNSVHHAQRGQRINLIIYLTNQDFDGFVWASLDIAFRTSKPLQLCVSIRTL